MKKFGIVLVTLVLVLVLGPPTVAAEVALLTYTGEHAITTPVLINPTTHDVVYPDSVTCTPIGGCQTVKGMTIKAGEVRRFDPVAPRKGIAGVYHVQLADPGLDAYSEITTGAGALFRKGPLTAVDHVRYLDVGVPNTRYNGWLIIVADGPMAILDNGKRIDLEKDDGILLAPPGASFTLDGQFGSKFYTVAGINDSITGSQQLVTPYP